MTPDVTVAFNNKGARIISWKLARFGDAAGRPEELVQTIKDAPHPLDLETGDTEVDARLRQALFQPSATQVAAEAGRPAEIRFRYAARTTSRPRRSSGSPATDTSSR